uniref:Uncharacterized protein n=1 Tax=Arundo donax TaxID=35708 RepID=A0A0A9FI64_ARUDO
MFNSKHSYWPKLCHLYSRCFKTKYSFNIKMTGYVDKVFPLQCLAYPLCQTP